ncbi:MAG: prepilin-type N-terminal cleavage/methylation domain-containing protein [Candidatus Peribacteria bacterium]|nr:prepilin-type N-terminal cleavage/methylation domain-containing protein [Candidatus Peribacteria bacterium]
MNSLVKTCENRIAQPIEREGFLNPFRFKAFTLTELIVVVTILAIL